MNGLIDLQVFMPMAAALLSYLLGRKTKAGRNAFVGAVVVLEFLFGLLLAVKGQGTESVLPGICGMGLRFTVDGFRAVYVVIAAFMWMVTGLFSPDYFAHYRNRNRYYLFQLVTLGATEGMGAAGAGVRHFFLSASSMARSARYRSWASSMVTFSKVMVSPVFIWPSRGISTEITLAILV